MTRLGHGTIAEAASDDDFGGARGLIEAYQRSLGIDLEFQHFSYEVTHLPMIYGPPRGVLLLARDRGPAIGCVGVRPFEGEICEMKRLYVAPAGRGRGLGRRLAQAAMDWARRHGYTRMRLDTLPQMHEAQALYASLGFIEVSPYRENPVVGSRFLEAPLAVDR